MSGVSLQTRPRSPTPSAERFVLTLWTNDPELAGRADAAGVDRIGLDLDRLGKAERQRGLGTWISPHRLADIEPVGAELKTAALFTRVNPLNHGTAREVESLLAHGVKVLMLPMVRTPDQAREFVRLVDGAALVVLLVEHVDAIRSLDELVAIEGVDEVHLGLNDLALSLGLRNRWLTLAGDIARDAGVKVRAGGKRFGLGALGRPDDDGLPVPPELVYAECARTGATAALLSRSFFRSGNSDLALQIARLHRRLAAWTLRPAERLSEAHAELARRAAGPIPF